MDAAILAAGWRVLAEQGYAGLGFDAVAEAAGCSRPALYRRFANKRDLVLAMMEARSRDVEPEVDPHADPRHTLVEHLNAMRSHLAQSGAGVVLGLAEASRTDPDLAAAFDRYAEGERRYYAEALDLAAGRPLAAERSELLIDTLLGAVMFRIVLRRGAISDAELERLADHALAAARVG
jgi:AcrR family transcriptional regulator